MSNASSSQLPMFNEARICETVPSLIKWTGSKRSQVKIICREIPPFKRYIEPFVGGGAMLYSAAHPEAIAGDLYQPLIELWRMVQSNPHMWSHQAQGTPISILSEVAQEKLDKLEPIVEKLMQV